MSTHNHGKQYRARIEDRSGNVEYSDWFSTEGELNNAMRSVRRAPQKTYQGEEAEVRCPECAGLGISPRVVSTL